jgi:N-glycosylase/DNA lyase
MRYTIDKNCIRIEGKEDFNIDDIVLCGQVFSYKIEDKSFLVFSGDKKAKIEEKENGYLIETDSPTYFENYFDLKTNYSEIKTKLLKHQILEKPIEFASGIRILNQNLFETLISFIVSANNNIKRIQLILNRMREKLGQNMGDYYAFPTQKQMLNASEEFFTEIGAGYRAKYLYQVVRQIDEKILEEWASLDTKKLREKLISLSGVGPKVADCVLLFGYHRGDVFPVDTWIVKMYNRFYSQEENREKIRENLVAEFGNLSGYAQQYLFYYQRSGN